VETDSLHEANQGRSGKLRQSGCGVVTGTDSSPQNDDVVYTERLWISRDRGVPVLAMGEAPSADPGIRTDEEHEKSKQTDESSAFPPSRTRTAPDEEKPHAEADQNQRKAGRVEELEEGLEKKNHAEGYRER